MTEGLNVLGNLPIIYSFNHLTLSTKSRSYSFLLPKTFSTFRIVHLDIMTNLPSIQSIRKALEAGEHAFLQWLYDEYREYCQQQLRYQPRCSEEDAEDIFMDALLIVRENMLSGKVKHLEGVRNYVLTVCLNVYRERTRARLQQVQQEVLVREALYDEAPEETEQINTYWQHKTDLATRALSHLGKSCQQLIRYYYVDRLSMADIAQKMHWASADVAKTSKSRCLRRWIKQIEALEQEESNRRLE